MIPASIARENAEKFEVERKASVEAQVAEWLNGEVNDIITRASESGDHSCRVELGVNNDNERYGIVARILNGLGYTLGKQGTSLLRISW